MRYAVIYLIFLLFCPPLGAASLTFYASIYNSNVQEIERYLQSFRFPLNYFYYHVNPLNFITTNKNENPAEILSELGTMNAIIRYCLGSVFVASPLYILGRTYIDNYELIGLVFIVLQLITTTYFTLLGQRLKIFRNT